MEQAKEAEVGAVESQPVEKTASVTAQNTAIPEYVDAILKKYPNYANLAVDAQGGVYTEDSQHLSKGEAILYQNPYYKH